MEENVNPPMGGLNTEPLQGSTPAQTPPAPQEPKPKSKLPIIIIGVILLILLIAGGAAAYSYWWELKNSRGGVPLVPNDQAVKPTSDPTADWNTYGNEHISDISFKYPSKWYEGPGWGGGEEFYSGFEMDFSNYPFKTKDSWGYSSSDFSSKEDYLLLKFIVSSSPDYKNQTASSFSSKEIPSNATNIRNSVVNGVDFIIYDTAFPSIPQSNNQYQYYTKAFTIKDGSFNSISLHSTSAAVFENSKSTFESILSTFKFTDDQAADTSNWKTYANNEYGFSFKYDDAKYSLEETKDDISNVNYIYLKTPSQTTRIEYGPSVKSSKLNNLKPAGTQKIGNNLWTIFSPYKFCDKNNCDTAHSAYYIMNKEEYILLTDIAVVQDADFSDFFSTFKFTN